jgi:hypothetical protein
MKRCRFVSIVVGVSFVGFAGELHAAGEEAVLIPVEAGYMFSPMVGIGGKALQAGTITTGFGFKFDRVGLMAFGRAAMGPKTGLGWGGIRGNFSLIDREIVELGPELGVSAGAGRNRGEKTGLMTAVEPGIYLRFKSDVVGAFDVRATWHQPLYVQTDGYRGALMLGFAWHPLFRLW